jgi:hypothetical protein
MDAMVIVRVRSSEPAIDLLRNGDQNIDHDLRNARPTSCRRANRSSGATEVASVRHDPPNQSAQGDG